MILLLLSVGDWSPGFNLALKQESPEAILEQVALRFEKTQGVAELVWQNNFEWGFW
jgi:hypothetical protein